MDNNVINSFIINDSYYELKDDVARTAIDDLSKNTYNKEALDSALTKKVDKVNGKSLISDEEISRLANVKNYDDTDISNRIKHLEDKENSWDNKAEKTDIPEVKDWALQEEKPEYTFSEVGADESGSAATALNSAKSYTDKKIADLINGAPETLDTLKELADAMESEKGVVEALDKAIGTKANKATTLEGYGISDAYTKEKIDLELNKKANSATTLSGYGITNAYTKTEVDTELNKKVNSESGKGLTANDYTTTDKNKLAGIEAGAQVNVQPDWNAESGDAFIKNKPTTFPASGGNSQTVNGHTVDTDVPANAKFTDTTYSSKTAVAGGTDISLVTTGEKAIWNSKYNKPTNGIPAEDLEKGVIPTSFPANNILMTDGTTVENNIVDTKKTITALDNFVTHAINLLPGGEGPFTKYVTFNLDPDTLYADEYYTISCECSENVEYIRCKAEDEDGSLISIGDINGNYEFYPLNGVINFTVYGFNTTYFSLSARGEGDLIIKNIQVQLGKSYMSYRPYEYYEKFRSLLGLTNIVDKINFIKFNPSVYFPYSSPEGYTLPKPTLLPQFIEIVEYPVYTDSEEIEIPIGTVGIIIGLGYGYQGSGMFLGVSKDGVFYTSVYNSEDFLFDWGHTSLFSKQRLDEEINEIKTDLTSIKQNISINTADTNYVMPEYKVYNFNMSPYTFVVIKNNNNADAEITLEITKNQRRVSGHYMLIGGNLDGSNGIIKVVHSNDLKIVNTGIKLSVDPGTHYAITLIPFTM